MKKKTTKRFGFSLATVLSALAMLVALSLVGYYQHMSPGSLRDRATDAELKLQLIELDCALIRWYYSHTVYENGEFAHRLPETLDLVSSVSRGGDGDYGSWLYNAGLSDLASGFMGVGADVTYTRVSDSEYTLTAVSREDTAVTFSSPMSGIDLEEEN